MQLSVFHPKLEVFNSFLLLDGLGWWFEIHPNFEVLAKAASFFACRFVSEFSTNENHPNQGTV